MNSFIDPSTTARFFSDAEPHLVLCPACAREEEAEDLLYCQDCDVYFCHLCESDHDCDEDEE